jgi:beta-galactosidase
MQRSVFFRKLFFCAVACLFFAGGCGSSAPCVAQSKRLPPIKATPSTFDGLRTREAINKGWKFLPKDAKGAEQTDFDDAGWINLDLPHTWNADDTLDDAPDYRRGVGWYRKTLSLDRRHQGRKLFLYFEGANQVADLYVNGKLVGRHKGGYAAFAFDVTDFVQFDSAAARNVIAVKVDNGIDENIPPSPTADFNLYGGIYRDVWLVATDPIHINVLDHASPGVYIDTPTVSEESATVRVRGTVVNDTNQPRQVRVLNTIVDTDGRKVAEMESVLPVAARAEGSFQQISAIIQNPRLWSPDSPRLYSVRTQIFDDARLADQVENPLGFRWFSFDADRGFFLNGKPYKLRGTNRHQDYAGMGNALPDEVHVRDLERIKETGFNAVLIAHYPQDPSVLEAADRLGLIVWEEIPIVRQISTSDEFAENCKLMLTEMIRQHYNHPSIVMWCYMNEIFLRRKNEAGYVQKTVGLARALDALARREDPTRLTVISVNRPYDASDIYNASGLLDIPHVVGWHMYFGWYYGEFKDFGNFLDEQHRRYPRRIIFVSEYGADYDPHLHSLTPALKDSTAEWARAYHESYLSQIEARTYLGGSAVWAQNDFGSEARGDSLPHVNTKGLLTFDRRPKDIYYLYKATFSVAPVLHIATRDWSRRTGSNPDPTRTGSERVAIQPVTVYANLPSVELFVNRKSLGAMQTGAARRATWNVPFVDGLNIIEARGRIDKTLLTDRAEVQFFYRPSKLNDTAFVFRELAVNVGSPAQFIDAAGHVWEKDQPYSPGGWGYEGGTPDSTSQNTLESQDDPLYQTMRQGLAVYRFDVPDGSYEIELRFAEHSRQKPGERVFSVSLNEEVAIAQLDLVKESGAGCALVRTFRVNAARGRGVAVQFKSIVGEPVLSAVRIRRL